MSFRQWALLIFVVATTASCSYFFKEEQEPGTVYKISLNEKAGVSCIHENGRVLREYFRMERDDRVIVSDLKRMKGCVKSAVDLFVRHTKGAQQDTYTAKEIHDFLTSVFDSYNFSLSFMQEAMALKYSLLGGSTEQVSKNEIRHLNVYIDYMYDALIELAPDRHRLFSKAQDGEMHEFERSSANLQRVIGNFKNLPRKTQGDFDYDSFVRLIQYVFDSETDWDHWEKSFDLVNSLQALLTVGQLGKIEISKLPDVLSDLGKLFLGYIQFHKYVKEEYVLKDLSAVFMFPGLITRIVEHHEVFTNERVDALVKTQDRIANGLKSALQRVPENKIPLSYFDVLIQTLHRIGSIPEAIHEDTLQKMMPELFGCWLSDTRDCRLESQREVQSFSQISIDVLQRFTAQWKERQLWINSQFPDHKLRVNKKSFVQSMFRSRSRRSDNINNLLSIVAQVNHLHWEEYVVIGERSINYKDLVIFNQIHTLNHIFLRPFNNNASKANLSDYYLSSVNSQFFYDWFRPLALDLKMGDPRSRTSGIQAMLEINIFGSSSSKPDQFDFAEVVEYFQIAISTSNRSVHIMTSEMQDCHTIATPPDVFGYERFNANCVREKMEDTKGDLILSTQPKLRHYFATNSTSNLPLFLKALEKSGRQGLIADDPFETDAFRMMGSISQYSESLFLRFDTNEDDVLSPEELERGLKHIVPNIRLLIRANLSATELKQIDGLAQFEKALVTYIIKYKELPGIISKPEGSNLLDKLAFGNWHNRMPSELNRMQAKREDIILVISALSSFSRVNRLKNLRGLFEKYATDFDKGITNPNEVPIREIMYYLQCSTNLDNELQLWLIAHQDEYWKNVLTVREVRDANGVERDDIRDQWITGDWQGLVVNKLLEKVNADQLIGPYCLLPMTSAIRTILDNQEMVNRRCSPRGVCEDVPNPTPY